MRKIFLFMMVTLDGLYEGENHDIDWHHVDGEFEKFAIAQLHEADTLMFGRRTYELMAGYWPTKEAIEGDRETAELMNSMPKVVVSTKMQKVEETEHWKNIQLISDNVAQEIAKLKEQPGKDIALLGSSDLAVSLLEYGLLDEARIMVNPVVIGKGKQLFAGLKEKVDFTLKKSRTFGNGNVLLTYEVKK